MKYLSIIIFAFLFLQHTAKSQEIKERTEELIKKAFAEDVSFTMQKYQIPASLKSKIEKKVGQKFFADHLFIYKIHSAKKLKGIAVLDNVYGKSMPITFLVIFDPDGKIISSNIVKYREPYGGAVTNKGWNQKFEGKNASSGFVVGKDVDAISGATISVNSVAKGINKLALLIEEIKDKI
jgi:Na+-translocating ferredoxin:NAD+ oxidoreductase RnfG subunit